MPAIQEEASKYGFHYFPTFISKVLSNNISYHDHFNNLKFDKSFFLELIASHPELQTVIHDDYATWYLETMDENLATAKNEEFTISFLKKVKFHFKQEMAAVYIDSLKKPHKEIKDDLKYALEDEEYYVNRRYIGQEKDIGGPVSEEERLKEIQSAQEKQKLLKTQLETFNKVESELQAVKNKTTVSI